MAKPSNRQVWEKGIPISDAWFEFAKLGDQRRYSELASPEGFEKIASNTKLESGRDILNFISAGFGQWTAKGQFQNDLRWSLLVALANDQLAAFGFRVSPSRSSGPVRIAAESFREAKANWKMGEVTARGCTYLEIRIIDLGSVANWERSRPGPKGSGDAVRAAIRAIQKRDIDLCGIPRKMALGLIKAELGEEYTKGSGLSEVNLGKFLLEFCPARGILSK